MSERQRNYSSSSGIQLATRSPQSDQKQSIVTSPCRDSFVSIASWFRRHKPVRVEEDTNSRPMTQIFDSCAGRSAGRPQVAVGLQGPCGSATAVCQGWNCREVRGDPRLITLYYSSGGHRGPTAGTLRSRHWRLATGFTTGHGSFFGSVACGAWVLGGESEKPNST